MDLQIRPARAEDKAAIAAFTGNTFTWGDYIVDAFDRWLTDDRGQLVVATDDDGTAVAVVHWRFIGPAEVWGEGIRVDPRYRRRGISARLTEEGVRWAREHGAEVIRLVTEDWNEPAQHLLDETGFRQVSRWAMWERQVGNAAPNIPSNGGTRQPAGDRLMPAGRSEVDPAFIAWQVGEISTAAHGFITERWTWRKFQREDLEGAARRRALWVCPAGWLIGEADDERSDTFWVSWVATTPDDAYRLFRAAIDRAADQGAERLVVMLPEAAWLEQAVRRAGLATKHRVLVYELPLMP